MKEFIKKKHSPSLYDSLKKRLTRENTSSSLAQAINNWAEAASK